MLLIDPDSLHIVDANNAASIYYGWSCEELRKKKISQIDTLSEQKLKAEFSNAKKGKKNHFLFKHQLQNHEVHDVQTCVVPISTEEKSLLCLIIHDITETKRMEEEILLEKARLRSILEILGSKHDSIQEFLDFALNEAIKLTNSEIGYIYYYSEKKEQFTLNTWSNDVMKECEITEPQIVYNLKGTGLWGEAVRQRKTIIVNDFHATNPLKKGYPEGHVKLHKFMTIPIFKNNKIVAVVGVANKESDYTENDTLQLTLLMDSVWNIIGKIGAENALKESEQKYRGLFESGISGVAIHKMLFDENGNPIDYIFLDANEAFEKHTGLEVNEVIGKTVTEVLPGIEETTLIDTYGKVVLTGTPANFETFSPPLNKNYSINAYKIDKDYFATVFQDITERKQTEKKIIEEHKRLENIIEGTNVGTWEWNIQTGGTSFNERWAEIIGYTLDELTPLDIQTWNKLIHPDDIEKATELLKKHFAGELDYYQYEERMRHKNGEWMWVLSTGKVIEWDDSGKPLLMYGTYSDITVKRNVLEGISSSKTQMMELLLLITMPG
jgi:PAS domain S-box-containing protein